ncbi:MAG: hypothetical protein MSL80_08330 [Helicobacter sp.]|uniref:hypothetical protein n=1 Tax=Helicobacter sp. TaxID=218 RepID=UPI003752BC48|nr:hypothetical protein [Helicobacter sp.]
MKRTEELHCACGIGLRLHTNSEIVASLKHSLQYFKAIADEYKLLMSVADGIAKRRH